MKKYFFITLILSLLMLFAVTRIVNASLEVSEDAVSSSYESLLTFKSNEFLELMDLSDEVSTISEFTDDLTGEVYYSIETDNSILKINYDTKEVTGYYRKTITFNFEKTADSNIAEDFIVSKYSDLGLPEEYELMYLEEFDDYCWEADFQKKYDDIYNMYEAVKVFFVPETDEILALTVFDTEYIPSSEKIMSEEDAMYIAEETLDSEIQEIKLTIIKSNNYFEDNSSDNTLYKAYIVIDENNESVFIDAKTGDIIGGDCINE